MCRRNRLRIAGRVVVRSFRTALLAFLLLASAGRIGFAAAPGQVDALHLSLPTSPASDGMLTGSGGIFGHAVIGDDKSLTQLAVGNVQQPDQTGLLSQVESNMKTFSLSDPTVWQGKTQIALGHLGSAVFFSQVPTADWILGTGELKLSTDVALTSGEPSLYDRVVSSANKLQAGRLSLQGVPLINEANDALLVADSTSLEAKAMTDVAGIKLSARVALPSSVSPLDAAANPDSYAVSQLPSYGLRAETKVNDNLALAADLTQQGSQLVDVDDITLGSNSKSTLGLAGQLAVNKAATVRAGYALQSTGSLNELGVRTEAGVDVKLTPRAQVSASYTVGKDAGSANTHNRASVGLGYDLGDNAFLKAMYQLIDFGSDAQSAGGSFAGAELKMKF